MKAMILAAGKGTRLGELTREVPKPLMPLADGVKTIDVTVDRLRRAGIVEIAVNLHHLGHLVQSHLETSFPDINWAFFPEEVLLNTGGGILNARSFLSDSEHFVVSNSDILHSIPITDVVRAHIESGARATMVLKPSGAARAVAYCPERGVLGFTNPGGELYYGRAEPKPPISYGTFCGVQVLHRSIFDVMAGEAFSIIDTYDALIGAGEECTSSTRETSTGLIWAPRKTSRAVAESTVRRWPPTSSSAGHRSVCARYSEAPATRRSSGSNADAGR